MDYAKSKQALVNEASAYADKQRKYAFFRMPDSPEQSESFKILSPRAISTYEPLREFTRLKRLEFGTTDSKMTIPDLTGLEAAATLKQLSFVARTTVKRGIEAIAGLKRLEELYLGYLVQELPSDLLFSLPRVRKLSLSRFNFDSPSALPPSLQELSLNFNELDRVPPYAQAPSVRKLSLGAQTCGLKDLGSLRVFPNAEEIRLLSPKKLHDLTHIAELRKLRILDANFCPAANLGGLHAHPAIEELRLRGGGARTLAEMSVCPKLKILYLEKSALASIESIREQFPALEQLWIWGTKVKDLRPLTGMVRLRHLDVTLLKPKSWDFLPTLTGLERLDLSKSSFSDVKLLLDLPSLRWVRLSGSFAERATADWLALERKLQKRGGELVHA